MSGHKQHFIPQSLLKGFGFTKGKSTYVVAYTYDRGTFTPATDGIGAERHFYSELAVKGEIETLDDRITAYETPFASVLSDLRRLANDDHADNEVAAEFVTHLAVRNDHFRKAVSSAGAALMNGIAGVFTSPDQAMAFLGLADAEPSALLAEQLRKAFEEYRPLLTLMGMTEPEFRAWAFSVIKGNFGAFHQEMTGLLSDAMVQMAEKVPETAANAQRRSLGEDLAPAQRVARMKELDWRVVHTDTLLVLPDCVAIGIDNEGAAYPLMLADLDTLMTVHLPLSSERLLIGSRASANDELTNLNASFAACSWDFFVARDRTSELDELRTALRSRVSQFLDDTVDYALGEAIGRHSAGPSRR